MLAEIPEYHKPPTNSSDFVGSFYESREIANILQYMEAQAHHNKGFQQNLLPVSKKIEKLPTSAC